MQTFSAFCNARAAGLQMPTCDGLDAAQPDGILEVTEMKNMNYKATVSYSLPRLILAGLLLFAISVPGETLAHEKRVMTVMTQNLYLGASLDPALAATTQLEFLGAVAAIYGTVQFTNFDARAGAIADTIDMHRPDIIGLQEVSTWTSVGPGAPPTQDFLDILQSKLAARGLNYVAVAESNNAQIGPVPQVFICDIFLQCFVTLTDRDVILVNADNADLVVTFSASGRYAAQRLVATPVGLLSFDRGWTYIDGTFEDEKFRFVNTHLETAAAAPIQEAQAQEFLMGPANTGGAVIAVGDFNSAADGSTTTTYDDLTNDFFKDAWARNSGDPGFTCCQNQTLTNFPSALASRIDLILTMGDAHHARRVEIVGDVPFFQGLTPPFWPSDHAGVIAEIRVD
jgi:endonuclease/exonuclease/phosphatase family metal-dependent hydrolase